MDYYDKVKEAADAVRARVQTLPQVAVVLGSGLGDFANSLTDAVHMPYDQLPHWPASKVIGHEGKLVVGTVKGRLIAALAGRSHLYEGHDIGTVSFAVRVLGVLGIKTLLLTNAAGGVNTSFSKGALMVIDDHINLMGANPLAGPNDDRFGPRFPDMTDVYATRLRRIADQTGRQMSLPLPHGVYAALLGPSYETPAEIRYLRTIGADAVGMSTVPEALVARHMGIDVLGISCITNMAAGVLPQPLNHLEVMETARRIRSQFIALLEGIIGQL
ncbi:MAG TPA: purine-nucleoside phosphorylase [Vicinamibacterales bacterium]|jgi:purine-nucleoside phosphorylase|nr:purine-nucleoside phosphorylase [Vicinamibacterales bacterium]